MIDAETINRTEKARDVSKTLENTHDELGATVQQYTVFLVEDDSDDRKLAIQTLRKSPYVYNIHSFGSGDNLLEHLDRVGHYSHTLMKHIPTLIMLDIHTPGTNGLNILRDLKRSPITRDIPVVILTSDTSDEAALEAYKFKANAFLTKPLSLDQVHEVIYASWEEANSGN